MRRNFLTLALILISCMASAQTQQGIVKTRGRMVNGQLVTGQRLTGATITLNIGNPLVSGNNGTFSFNVPSGKNYSLVAAKKQGYTLADPEYSRRSFAYSGSNPFYVVLEDETQRQADINAATRKVRRTLTAQLQAREDEIEALKAQNKLTEVEYQRRLQELYDNQSKSEQLVREMAERYASTDYDQLDEFNRKVQMYIEEGELLKADSMIRSKGDMEQRVADYHNVMAAYQKEREELAQRQQALTQSESGVAKTYEDLSQDLYLRSEIFLQHWLKDSALYCLKVRADLDTMNRKAVLDYADLATEFHFNEEAKKYYDISLREAIYNDHMIAKGESLHRLGDFYLKNGDYCKSLDYFQKAYTVRDSLFVENQSVYNKWALSCTLSSIGDVYKYLNDSSNAKKYLIEALAYRKTLASDNSSFKSTLCATLISLGNLFGKLRDYERSMDFYQEIIALISNATNEHELYVLLLAQNNIGSNLLVSAKHKKLV